MPEVDRPAPVPLLAAKLAATPPPAVLVRRPRLAARLDAAVAQGPVTVLNAAAGWGKSTALSDWYHQRRRHLGLSWLSVCAQDAADRLWAYLWAALDAESRTAQSAAPDADRGPRDLDRLAGVLAGRRDPAVLVVDDVHRLADPAAGDGLDFLLRNADGRLRVVLSGRGAAPLALHRWRLSGGLTEIDGDELAFTAAEAAGLLRAHGLEPADEDTVSRLCQRIEGWPAGLRFAALAARDHPEPSRALREFGGDHPDVVDYLTAEVLSGITGDGLDALRRIGQVEWVTGDLLDTLTGRDDGAAVLDDLARVTGLLLPLRSNPPTYRCWRPLAEALRARARAGPPGDRAELHRRAAGWYADNGAPVQALTHALAGSDWAGAGRIFAGAWPELVPYTRGVAAAAPAGQPATDPGRDPAQTLALAAHALGTGDAAATRHLDSVDPGQGRQNLVLAALALRSAQAHLAGDVEATRATAYRLRSWSRDRPEPDRVAGTAVAAALLGGALLGAGDPQRAEPELDAAVGLATRAGLVRPAVVSAGRVAVVRAVSGHLAAAERAAAVALDPPAGAGADSDGGYAHLAAALVALHRDRTDPAAGHLRAAAHLAEHWHEPAVAALATIAQAQLAQDRDDPETAHRLLTDARRRMAHSTGAAHRWLLVAEADLRTAQGDPEGARQLLRPHLEAAVGPVDRAALAVAVARAHLVAGEPQAAIRALPPPGDDLPLPLLLAGGLLHALSASAVADRRRAGDLLERMLALAEPDRFRRVFTRCVPSARDLLAAHADTGTAYAPALGELLAGTRRPAREAVAASAALLAEPLTERELTILRYLQSILSNVEIAGELSLSVNTVKTHVRNIYRKLDASRRREAVRRARELHLI